MTRPFRATGASPTEIRAAMQRIGRLAEVVEEAAADGSGQTPYFIAAGDEFVVPIYKCAICIGPLTIDGTLTVAGRMRIDG